MSAAGCHNVCLKAEAEIWSPLLPRHTGASSKFCWKHKQPFSRELGSFCPLPPPDSQSLPLWERFGVGSLLFSYTTGVSEHCFIEVLGNENISYSLENWRTWRDREQSLPWYLRFSLFVVCSSHCPQIVHLIARNRTTMGLFLHKLPKWQAGNSALKAPLHLLALSSWCRRCFQLLSAAL